MSFDNGNGSGGGNGSVWFEVQHGSDARPQTVVPQEPSAFAPQALAAPDAAHRHHRRPNGDRPPQGHMKLDNDGKCACLTVHDSTNLDDLGGDDHKGMFRVRLRIRKETMERLIDEEKDRDRKRALQRYWMALPLIAAKLQKFTGEDVPRGPNDDWKKDDTKDDVFLVVDVPAIKRATPADGEPWSDMPWEIYWQW